MAAGGLGLGHRARGLRRRADDLEGGAVARLTRAARLVPLGAAVVPLDQRAHRPPGGDPRVPVGHRLCRSRGPAADQQLARGRQARGPRGASGRERVGIASVWSWGWGTFDTAGADPDKPIAACTYLWTRDPALCDVLAQVDGDFNGSTDEGQILLAAGVQCQIGAKETITIAAIDRLAHLTRGRQAAIGALLVRDIVRGRKATQLAIRRQEAAIIYGRFKNSRPRYVAALARRGATPAVGRAALADGLKLQTIERGLHVRRRAPRPSGPGARRTAGRACASCGADPGRLARGQPGGHRPARQRRTAAGAARPRRADAARADRAGHRAHHGRQGAAAAEGVGGRRERDRLCADPLDGARRGRWDVARGSRGEGARHGDLRAGSASAAAPQSIAARAPFLRPLR